MGKLKKLWNDRSNQFRYARWMMHYTRPYIGKITLMMLATLAQTIMTLAMVQVTKMIIDNATGGSSFINLIVIYVAMVILLQILEIFMSLFSTMLNEKFSFGIRKQIYEKIIKSHWMDVKKYHTGDLMTRLTSDAGNIADGIVGTIPNIIKLCIELVLIFFMLFYYSPLLAVFALLVAPVAAVSTWWFLCCPWRCRWACSYCAAAYSRAGNCRKITTPLFKLRGGAWPSKYISAMC